MSQCDIVRMFETEYPREAKNLKMHHMLTEDVVRAYLNYPPRETFVSKVTEFFQRLFSGGL